MQQPDKKKKKEKKRRHTKPKVKVDTIRAVKFKTVDVPKIKAMPQSSEVDFSNQMKKETKPIIIHNYLYQPGQSQDLQREYEQMTASQLPLRQVAPVDQQSVREPPPEPPQPEPGQEPTPVTEAQQEQQQQQQPGRFVPTTAKEKRMVALQERGAPYTKDEAKLVFGIDLRTKSGRDTMQGLIEGGLVRDAWK
jgi:hypothetical protein